MFDDYYAMYLGINTGILINDCMVCKTVLRDMPLNKRFYYRIIISDYNGYRIVSVSPTISNSVVNNICSDIKDKTLDSIINSQQLLKTGLRVSKMYRMLRGKQKLDLKGFHSYCRSEYIDDNKKHIIRDSGNIISYCKASNIDFNYGNIVVWTDENHRRRGFARELLLKAISKCKEESIEPLYLVDSKNYSSIELAKSVGFRVVQKEIIACEVCN